MATPSNNLFLRLHKWAWRQDENFLTESLAVVLEQLLVLAPAVGKQLVHNLTGGLIGGADDAIEIRTQVDTETGRPDLEICADRRRARIEVKIEAELGVDQLKRYRALLEDYERKGEKTKLVLLTRYPHIFQPNEVCPDHQVRWFQVAHWFENELSAVEAIDEVAVYLGKQYWDFLRARNMTIEQVTWELTKGVRAFAHLLDMLSEAGSACKVTVTKTAGLRFAGIHLDRGKYAVNLAFDEPEKLWFGTRCPIDPEKAAKLNGGELQETKRGDSIWWRSAVLDSEDVHFFSRSRESQMRWLEEFLQDCLNKARSITTSDQPLPEVPEGN